MIDREVVAGEAAVGVDVPPGGAAVVRAIETGAGSGGDRGVDALALAARGHGEADAAQGAGGEPVAGEARPGLAAVGRLVEAAPRPHVGSEVGEPGVVADLPGRGEDRVRRGRIGGEVHGAGILVHEQHLLPALAAVRAAEDAALRAGSEEMPLDGREHHVGVPGIDPQPADVLALGEPARLPGLAAVGGAVDAVAGGDVPPGGDLAGRHVEHSWVAGSHRQGADRARLLMLEERIPRAPGVGGLPHPAVGRAEVERLRLPRHSGGASPPAAAQRADQAPPQRRVVLGRHGRGGGEGGGGETEGQGES